MITFASCTWAGEEPSFSLKARMKFSVELEGDAMVFVGPQTDAAAIIAIANLIQVFRVKAMAARDCWVSGTPYRPKG